MVAANKGYPSRKSFYENIAAFRELKRKHPDALLFLQTMAGEGARDACDLPDYCKTIGLNLGKDVLFCDQYVNAVTGFPDKYMVDLYNSFDVFLSVSRGEGFGIPILEAQSCGLPVIVGDWTAMPEVFFAGWKVDKKDTTPEFIRGANTYMFIPHVGAIYERLEAAYNMCGNPDYAKRAREGAEKFDVRKITEKYWKPALESIAERIQSVEALKAQVAEHSRLNVKEING
jgi:glycosyltransferase involved in cell wall biosynthesis